MINNSRPIVSYLRKEKDTRGSQNRLLGVLAAAAGGTPVLSQPNKTTLLSSVRETDVYCLQLEGAKPPPLGGSFSRFSVDSGT
jgi:hypothetical protein